MKKKRMMLLVLVTVLAFAGCAKEGTDTLGKGTEISVPGQEAENTDDKGDEHVLRGVYAKVHSRKTDQRGEYPEKGGEAFYAFFS